MSWKMADAAALVREIAAMDPNGITTDESETCVFCWCYGDRPEPDYDLILRHTPDCLWVRANALVKEMDS